MTTYADLRLAFASYSDAREAYWEDIHKVAQEIARGFIKFLSPEESYFIDGKNKTQDYVQAGKYSLGRFEPAHVLDLDSDGNTLNFAFQVALEETHEGQYKEFLILELSIQKTEGQYQVVVRSSEGNRAVRYSPACTVQLWEGLYDLLASEILLELDPKKYQ